MHVILTKKVCLTPDHLPAVSHALLELSLLENKPSGKSRRGKIRKDKMPAHVTVTTAQKAAGTHYIHCEEVSGRKERGAA